MVQKDLLTGIVLLSLLTPHQFVLAIGKSPIRSSDKDLIKEMFLDGLINEQKDATIDYRKNAITVNGYKLDEGFNKKYAVLFTTTPGFDNSKDENVIEIRRQDILSVAMADSDILHSWVISTPGGETINQTKSIKSAVSGVSASNYMKYRMRLANELIADGIAPPGTDIAISFVNRDATAPIHVNTIVLEAQQQAKYYPMLRSMASMMALNGHDAKTEMKFTIYRFELAKK